ncbi:MAG: hypothetical protein A2Y77_01935 [Planctomycetes bacterium RBG_13_62_9]|nr:MAG: hypothetical protein A2Y77_01935 [Planctomycetes bacterium RBG_13_62_9]
MTDTKSMLATLLNHILGDLSLIGRFAAFFGTTLLFSAVFVQGQARLLIGLDLIFLALADHYWNARDVGVPYSTGEMRFYRRLRLSKCVWAAVFFLAFLMLGYCCLRLPSVSEFLTTARLGFVVPGHRD